MPGSAPAESIPVPLPVPGNPVVDIPTPGDIVGAIPGVSQAQALTAYASAAAAWWSNRHNIVRVAWFVTGTALIFIGVAIVAGKPVATATASVAKTAAKVV